MNGYHMYTSQKKWLTFGGDQVPDTDSGSRIHFPHHRWIGDFRRFITISDTLTGRLLQYHYQYLAKWLTLTTEWIHYILGAIRQTLGSGLPSTNRSNPGSLLVDILALVEVCALWVRSSYWMWLVSSPHHSILYVIDLWTWSVLLRNTSTWLWTTKLFKWISLDQRKFRTVFVIMNVMERNMYYTCLFRPTIIRGPRNNICYSGHVKYFSDWLIDWYPRKYERSSSGLE